jgi:hypothetical protein
MLSQPQHARCISRGLLADQRRTFILLLLAIGEDVPYVMGQVGPFDPKVTLSIYAQVMFRGEGERERLEALVNGSDWAPLGTSAQSERLEAERFRTSTNRSTSRTGPMAGCGSPTSPATRSDGSSRARGRSPGRLTSAPPDQ